MSTSPNNRPTPGRGAFDDTDEREFAKMRDRALRREHRGPYRRHELGDVDDRHRHAFDNWYHGRFGRDDQAQHDDHKLRVHRFKRDQLPLDRRGLVLAMLAAIKQGRDLDAMKLGEKLDEHLETDIDPHEHFGIGGDAA